MYRRGIVITITLFLCVVNLIYGFKTQAETTTDSFVKIAASLESSYGIKADGSFWAWGNNSDGQFGDGTYKGSLVPKKIEISGIVSFVAERDTLFIIKDDGSLWSCGNNDSGKAGGGKSRNRNTLLKIMESGVCAVSSGNLHTIVLKLDGSVWAWGDNVFGQVGDGTNESCSTPKKVIEKGVVSISAGNYFSTALKTDGSLWAWGDNKGTFGNDTTKGSNVPIKTVEGGIKAVSCGAMHTVALTMDGGVWVWGDNFYGQIGDGTTTNVQKPKQIIKKGVKAISAKDGKSLVLKDDGSLWEWGYNNNSHVSVNTIAKDGTVSYSNRPDFPNTLSPKKVVSDSVETISTGGNHTLFLKSDGSLWAWGWNDFGQIGDGSTAYIGTPKLIAKGNAIPTIASEAFVESTTSVVVSNYPANKLYDISKFLLSFPLIFIAVMALGVSVFLILSIFAIQKGKKKND